MIVLGEQTATKDEKLIKITRELRNSLLLINSHENTAFMLDVVANAISQVVIILDEENALGFFDIFQKSVKSCINRHLCELERNGETIQ